MKAKRKPNLKPNTGGYSWVYDIRWVNLYVLYKYISETHGFELKIIGDAE